jgi:hypothetical protein
LGLELGEEGAGGKERAVIGSGETLCDNGKRCLQIDSNSVGGHDFPIYGIKNNSRTA